MSTFGEVKIKQLPSIASDKILDDDLLVIDKADDTYSVTVNALKAIFSSDNKILAVQQELLNAMNTKYDEINKVLEEISSNINTDNSNIQELTEYMEKSKKDILGIQNSITGITKNMNLITTAISQMQSNMSSTDSTVQSIVKTVNELATTTETNTNNISTLVSTTRAMSTSLSDLTKEFGQFKENQEQKNTELVKNDGELVKQSKEYCDEKYDELMRYIDEYHHIYPVGTLYHTTDKDGDVKDLNVFGVWRLVGQVTLSTEDNIIEYIFKRIK